jgi:hypothetical protein
MWRRQRGVQPNCIAIVKRGLVPLAELSLSNPKQVLDRRIPRGEPMRLFQPDQSLIETTFSKQSHTVIECSILRGE